MRHLIISAKHYFFELVLKWFFEVNKINKSQVVPLQGDVYVVEGKTPPTALNVSTHIPFVSVIRSTKPLGA
jgi:hypothetical protein